MTEQTALRLADVLASPLEDANDFADIAAVELRRLHSVNAVLLEALKKLDNFFETYRPEGHPPSDSHELVRAAIKAVEGEKE